MRCTVPVLGLLALALAGCGDREPPPPRLLPPVPASSASASAAALPPRAAAADLIGDRLLISAGDPAPPAEGRPLARAEVMALARANNRGFRSARLGLERARLGQAIARSDVYAPKLAATWSSAKGRYHAGAFADGADSASGDLTATVTALGFDLQPYLKLGWNQTAHPGADSTYTTREGITLSRRVFALAEHLRKALPITDADQGFLTAVNSLLLQARRLDLDSTRAFFNLQRAELRLRLRERRVGDAKAFLESTRQNVRLGLKAPVEELNATINLNQAESDLLDEQTRLQDTREALADHLAWPLLHPVAITPEDLAQVRIEVPDLARDLDTTLRWHEDLLNAALAIDRKLVDLRIQRDQLLPQVTATLTAERSRTGDRAFAAATPDDDVQTYTLGLTWNLVLDGWAADRARLQQLRDSLTEQTIGLRQKQIALEQQLRQLHRHIEQNLRSEELTRLRLDSERAKLAATINRYQAGAIDNLEVTRAQADTDNAEIALVEARIGLVLAAAEYAAVLPNPITREDPDLARAQAAWRLRGGDAAP